MKARGGDGLNTRRSLPEEHNVRARTEGGGSKAEMRREERPGDEVVLRCILINLWLPYLRMTLPGPFCLKLKGLRPDPAGTDSRSLQA